MRFVVFGPDGTPLRVGSCPEEALQDQAREGETVREWNGEPLTP